MRSPLAARQGSQRPSVCWVPEYVSTTGREALEVCEMAGLFLDDWQAYVLTHALGEQENGRWAAFEVGLTVPRQNGKGSILEARELVGLFLLGERLIVHSAHQFDTSLEAFRRLLELIESTPSLEQRVKRVSRSHGEEGIELKGGQRVRFRTRTKGGGRGFSGDCLILDEAMILPQSAHGALLPTLSARPNPQVWYTGSAVDQHVHEHGIVFARVRERGLRGDDPSLAYFEWSVDADIEDADELADDPEAWAQANPGLGIRITSEYVANEARSMAARTFAVERLGVGDWPTPDDPAATVIDMDAWAALKDACSQSVGTVRFAVDVAPDRSYASISAAGSREDDRGHIEVVDRRRGTGWVVGRVQELLERHDAAPEIVLDAKGPAGSLLSDFEDADVKVHTTTASEHAQACGGFFDAVEQRDLRHLGTPELTAALRGAAKRPLGDAWAWSRKSSGVDISPLVACTLAFWGSRALKPADFFFEVLS